MMNFRNPLQRENAVAPPEQGQAQEAEVPTEKVIKYDAYADMVERIRMRTDLSKEEQDDEIRKLEEERDSDENGAVLKEGEDQVIPRVMKAFQDEKNGKIRHEHMEILVRELAEKGLKSTLANEILHTQGFENWTDALSQFKLSKFEGLNTNTDQIELLELLAEDASSWFKKAVEKAVKHGGVTLAVGIPIAILTPITLPMVIGATTGGFVAQLAGRCIGEWQKKKALNTVADKEGHTTSENGLSGLVNVVTAAQEGAIKYMKVESTDEFSKKKEILGSIVDSIHATKLKEVGELESRDKTTELYEWIGEAVGGVLGGGAGATLDGFWSQFALDAPAVALLCMNVKNAAGEFKDYAADREKRGGRKEGVGLWTHAINTAKEDMKYIADRKRAKAKDEVDIRNAHNTLARIKHTPFPKTVKPESATAVTPEIPRTTAETPTTAPEESPSQELGKFKEYLTNGVVCLITENGKKRLQYIKSCSQAEKKVWSQDLWWGELNGEVQLLGKKHPSDKTVGESLKELEELTEAGQIEVYASNLAEANKKMEEKVGSSAEITARIVEENKDNKDGDLEEEVSNIGVLLQDWPEIKKGKMPHIIFCPDGDFDNVRKQIAEIRNETDGDKYTIKVVMGGGSFERIDNEDRKKDLKQKEKELLDKSDPKCAIDGIVYVKTNLTGDEKWPEYLQADFAQKHPLQSLEVERLKTQREAAIGVIGDKNLKHEQYLKENSISIDRKKVFQSIEGSFTDWENYPGKKFIIYIDKQDLGEVRADLKELIRRIQRENGNDTRIKVFISTEEMTATEQHNEKKIYGMNVPDFPNIDSNEDKKKAEEKFLNNRIKFLSSSEEGVDEYLSELDKAAGDVLNITYYKI